MNSITGEPFDTGGDADFTEGGEFPVGGPGNTNDASFKFQVETDEWVTGIDASDASSRPYKIARTAFGTHTGTSGDVLKCNEDGSVRITEDLLLGGKGFLGAGLNTPEENVPFSDNTGIKGDIRWSQDYIFICVDTDTWKRVGIVTFPIEFEPTAGFTAHYDASDASSVSQSSGLITTWNDVSGTGMHMDTISGTVNSGNTSLNGLNVVDYIGNCSSVASSALVNYESCTVFMVVKYDALGATTEMWSNGTGNADGGCFLTMVGTKLISHQQRNLTLNAITPTDNWNTDWRIVMWHCAPSLLTYYAGDHTKDTLVPTGLASTANHGCTIHTRTVGASLGEDISVGELIIYSTALSVADINKTGDYLSNKWSITWNAFA